MRLNPLREEGGRERKEEVLPTTLGFKGEETKAVETDRMIDCWVSSGASEEEVRGRAAGIDWAASSEK